MGRQILIAAVLCLLLSLPALAQQPAPPAGVVVGQINLTLQWDPNTETDLTGYKAYFGTAPGTYGTPTSIGKTNTLTLYGFAAGTYYFAVTAFNAAGLESGFSNEVSATIVSPAAPPPATFVQGPLLVDIASTSAQLAWKTSVATTSRIEYQAPGGDFISLVIDTDPVTDHWVRLASLTGGKIYAYTVICETATARYEASGSFKTK
jgi:hypothetical protein